MNILLFDTPEARNALKPFSFTRPLAKIRVGIATVEEKWKHHLSGTYSFLTEVYLSKKFALQEDEENLLINSTICPDKDLVESIKQLKLNEKLVKESTLMAFVCDRATLKKASSNFTGLNFKKVDFDGTITQIKNKWDIFLLNDQEIRKDFQWICQGRTSQTIEDKHTITYGLPNIFLEEGVSIRAAILNAEAGPIYIGKNAVIQEGAIIRGPVAMGEGTQINAGAKIQEATTIGPYAKVGGEIYNSVIFGYSNKAHEGFLGNTVIGEWCNLGAGTNISNLKNSYDKVKVWDYHRDGFVDTRLQFCGVFMGDHSKCGINTMLNSGTVVGVSVNLFGAGFCEQFIPSFTWGGADTHTTTYRLNKALEVAENVMNRRSQRLTEEDKYILTHIFRATAIYRIKANI